MGKINQGILDGFNGKVGTVVGYFWKGKPVMRGYKRFMHDKHSEAQMIVRLRFAILSELASAFRPAALVGFKSRSKSRGNTEVNNFMQLNWDAVQAFNTADVAIDYAALQLASGSLPPVQFGSAKFDTPLTVEASFAPGSDLPGASNDDHVYLFAYNPATKMGVIGKAATRAAGKASVTVPSTWSGETVHVWGLVSGGAPDTIGRSAASTYLGEGDMA
ncbi:MAG: hypothetical protein J6I49_01720 [Bacteroidales bacterium]|nr:hypothetical protein [Bacteroidales bacterium]